MGAHHPSTPMIRVWDRFVRGFHWAVLAAFVIAYISEGEPMWLHAWAGYFIAVLVVMRIGWGFVGPETARFSRFVAHPREIIAYLKALPQGKAKLHLGHSPAGGAMTIALLAALLLTVVSGAAMLALESSEGPLAPWLWGAEGGVFGWSWRDVAYGLHEACVSLMTTLIVLHLAGVALASIMHRENLVAAMWHGKKPIRPGD